MPCALLYEGLYGRGTYLGLREQACSDLRNWLLVFESLVSLEVYLHGVSVRLVDGLRRDPDTSDTGPGYSTHRAVARLLLSIRTTAKIITLTQREDDFQIIDAMRQELINMWASK